MHRLINLAARAGRFVARCCLAARLMRGMNYSAHLAWIKAAR